jgi:hypothetical protein
MRKCLTAPLCLAALLLGASGLHAEEAINLRGQWHVTVPSDPNYVGVVLIDAEHRLSGKATLPSPTAR